MSRIRYLKPDFFKDEDLALLPFETRLFFAGLWNFADKAGRLENRPRRLKIEIFPYDNVDIEKCIKELSKSKNGSNKPFIQEYEIDGCQYIQITNWEKHQRPHHTEKESLIPPVPLSREREKGKGMEKQLEASRELDNGAITVKTTLSDNIIVREIVEDLNNVVDSNYKYTTKLTISLINARLKDGFTLDDFKAVHRKMFKCWFNKPDYVRFLRPETLYGNKFEGYLNQKEVNNLMSDVSIHNKAVIEGWLKKKGQENED
ncbi:MAG: conserved phage C-terminal domain-containing protein [Bacteroidota bacterium]